MAAFTFLWTNECRMNMLDQEGDPLDTAAGNMFSRRGVGRGDHLYIVTVWKGKVYFIGRMKVRKVWGRGAWDDEFPTPTLWEGDEVVEGEEGTPMRMERTLSPAVLRRLRFTDRTGREKGLALNGNALKNPQCLRSVRRLTPESAALLDELLEVPV